MSYINIYTGKNILKKILVHMYAQHNAELDLDKGLEFEGEQEHCIYSS